MKRIRYTLAIILLLINIVALHVWYGSKSPKLELKSHETRPQLSQLKYEYGDSAPSFQRMDNRGRAITSDSYKGKICLLIFFNPASEHDRKVISYADVLWNKYKDKGLVVLAIARTPFYSTHSIPIIIDDAVLSIHRLFGVSCGGTVLIDEKGIIRFITGYTESKDVIRQIVEKHVCGFIRIPTGFKEPPLK